MGRLGMDGTGVARWLRRAPDPLLSVLLQAVLASGVMAGMAAGTILRPLEFAR